MKRGPFLNYLKKHHKKFHAKKDEITFETIEKFFRLIVFHTKMIFLLKNFDDIRLENELVEYPEFNLFLWALLFDRYELSKIFWKRGKVIN